MIPFTSTKHAIAEAATLSKRLDLPRTTPTATCPACAGEELHVDGCKRCGGSGTVPRERGREVVEADQGQRAIAVRAVLRLAGVDPDGEDAQLLYLWATTTDAAERLEAEAVLGSGRAMATQRRLDQLLETATRALKEHGVVVPRPRLQLREVGYVVHELDDGTRKLHTVIDPSALDTAVYRGPTAKLEALAVVERRREGPVLKAGPCGLTKVLKPELRDEVERERRFEWLVEIDEWIAERLKVSLTYAKRVRASWGQGYQGAPGRARTPAP